MLNLDTLGLAATVTASGISAPDYQTILNTLTGHRYQKGGVMLQDFYSQGVAQLGLFDEYKPRHNSEKLMGVLDRINNSGRAKLWFAGQGAHQVWSMKRELLSPAYTTRLSDLPRARVY